MDSAARASQSQSRGVRQTVVTTGNEANLQLSGRKSMQIHDLAATLIAFRNY
jgi:hypothetical protein